MRPSPLRLQFGLLIALSAIALPLFAHHGPGIFDSSDTVTVTGTVTEFQFVNPHVLIFLEVVDEQGNRVQWGGELTSPNRLARMGTAVKWHRNILEPGQRIEMTGHPARNGAPALSVTRIIDTEGLVLIGAEE